MKVLDYLYRWVNKELEGLDERSYYYYEGINYPKDIFRIWTDEELNTVGIYRVTPVADIPEGKVAVAWEYEIDGRVARATPVLEDTPIYVPQEVTRAQGKGALVLANLLGDAEQYIESLEGKEKMLALIAFNETNTWQRNSEFLKGASVALGLTEEDLDDLFITAAEIEY